MAVTPASHAGSESSILSWGTQNSMAHSFIGRTLVFQAKEKSSILLCATVDIRFTSWYYEYMIHKTCTREGCSNEFDSKDNRKNYCSRSCAVTVNNRLYPKRVAATKTERKSKLQQWLDGEWDGTTRQGLSATIRNYLLESAGFRCQDGRSGCDNWSGYNPKSGKSCLTVDHTDGNCMNNKIENLKVMCPNCHSMTPTYGALNKGNGRAFRYSVVA